MAPACKPSGSRIRELVLSCSNSNCVVVLTDSQGTFTSPCYPQVYPKSQACKWTLQAPAGFIVQITFFNFDLEEAVGCIYDRVIVNTGNQDVKFCGLTANGLTLNSTSNVMEMSFNSDSSVQKNGFNVSYRQVAVPLRDQKVMLPNGNGKVVKVSNSVTIPTLQQFTVCFEVARSNQKNKETIFSYTRQEDSSGDEALSFGMNQDGMALVMSNETCLVDSILNPSDFTSTMKPFCLTWASTTGKVTLYYNRNSLTKTCSNTNGRLVGAGGLFRLGGKNSFDGTIYNFRLWDNAMSMTQLANLTCDAVGNVIDWDNSFWDIPSLLAQTDRTLSCSDSKTSLGYISTPLFWPVRKKPEATIRPILYLTKPPPVPKVITTTTALVARDNPFSLFQYDSPYSLDEGLALAASGPHNLSHAGAGVSTEGPDRVTMGSPVTAGGGGEHLHNQSEPSLPWEALAGGTLAEAGGEAGTGEQEQPHHQALLPATMTDEWASSQSSPPNTISPSRLEWMDVLPTRFSLVSLSSDPLSETALPEKLHITNFTEWESKDGMERHSAPELGEEVHVTSRRATRLYPSLDTMGPYTTMMMDLNMSPRPALSSSMLAPSPSPALPTPYISRTSVQPSSDLQLESKRYTCQALLVYKTTTNVTLVEAAIFTRLGRSVAVQSVENCTRETPLHYIWPESRPTVTQYIPCFPNKDQTASRTCVISPLNYTAFWGAPDLRNCIDIGTIKVSAENAAEVAVQLDDITNNELSTDEVFKVARKVNELVKVAKINTPLAKTVVSILSNVMTSSVSALTAASECTLKTVDELVQKIEFDGPTVNITSKNLALGISALNYSKFNGTSFSAFIHPNTTDLQVAFKSDQLNPLAQVTLPATLLNNLTLTNAEIAAVSRINFMFFRKTGLFQDEQDGLSLNSYVVASSVGNYSISNLQDPVEIEIVHLNYQTKPEPTCMFWDFTMKNGTGGWNSKGCRVSPMSNRNKTICLCDHLTHFGILMDISGSAVQIDEKNTKILTFITYIGCGISAIFSAATLLTYIAFEKLRRDYPSKILMNLSTSLLFLNMVFLLDGWLASFDVEGLCVAVAVFLHFFLLTSFTWMGLESIHMYIALVKVFNTYIRRYILKFCIVGWGLPAAIVAIVVAFDKNSYGKIQYGKGETGQGSSEFCWIRSQVVFYVTCVGYFSVLFLLNVAMFIVVMIQICGRNGKRSNHTLREEMLRNLRSVISLTFLLGMTWGFAFFAWGPVNLAFMYLFSIFNSLQGLFIFIFHCALKENVQKQWRRYLCFGRFRLSDNSDWSKTATNNTKKASSDTVRKSLSSSSFGSSTANWTSKAKATLNPFAKRSRNAGKGFSNQTNAKTVSSEGEASSSIIPVHQVIDKVKGYCSVRSDNFYKNIIMSDSFSHSTKF
ncbi:adhesion G-protein coupled receptor G6 [Salvelinus namaycush]|uniref:Adhesion G-protein coupled receptor G6 n=1 Tax=Salvelinus namaycush TaxID=8040 RepID=A0A8U0TQI8_SALNM|nr:adhesion G-protein coupled receptor G6 [Salvelinus namaycush]